MSKKPLVFTDLFVWQKAHALVLKIYTVTKTFPQGELYGLVSQMNRAAVSITANIAEGFVRKNKKEKIQFYFIALGANTELHNHILIARDLKYIKPEQADQLINEVIESSKLINSLISSCKSLN